MNSQVSKWRVIGWSSTNQPRITRKGVTRRAIWMLDPIATPIAYEELAS